MSDSAYHVANRRHPPASRFIGIERCHHLGPDVQLNDRRLDQSYLPRTGPPAQAGIPGPILRVRRQRGVRERVNGAFGQHQTPVVRLSMREPEALLATRGKALKSAIL